jgi:hypothetical protein
MDDGTFCPSFPSELIGFAAPAIGLCVVVAAVVGVVVGATGGVVIAPSDDVPEDAPCGVN